MVGLADKVGGGDVDVGGDIARQVEAEEDSDEGSEMDGDGKQVEEVGGSGGVLGKVQEEELVVEGDNAEGRGLAEGGELVQETPQPVGDRAWVMGNWVGCKLAGKGVLVGRGGVDGGVVIVLLLSASEVVEMVEAGRKQGQEKLEVVSMGLEMLEVGYMGLTREREGGLGFLEDLPGEGMECTRGKAQQRGGRMEVVKPDSQNGDVAPWVPDGDWSPKDGEDGQWDVEAHQLDE